MLNIGKFNSMVSLAAFFPFKSAQAALDNMNAISEGKGDFFDYFSFFYSSCLSLFVLLVWSSVVMMFLTICQSTECLC